MITYSKTKFGIELDKATLLSIFDLLETVENNQPINDILRDFREELRNELEFLGLIK